MCQKLFPGNKSLATAATLMLWFLAGPMFSQIDTTALIRIAEETNNDSIKIENYLLLNDYFQSNDLNRSNAYLDKIFELSDGKSDEFMIAAQAQAFNRKGILYTIQGDYVNALKSYQDAESYFKKLREIAPQSIDYKQGVLNTLGNIGTIYYHQENYAKAIKYWEETLVLIRDLDIYFAEAQLLNNIGVIYKDIKEYSKALEYLNQGLEIFQNLDSPKNVAMCYTNIGEIFDELDLPSKSLEYLLKSLELKEQLADIHGLAQCLGAIARLYNNIGEIDQSIIYAKRSLKKARQINNKKDICLAYEILAKNYAELGDFKNAYKMHVLYSQLNDSLFDIENHDKFLELQTKYETEKKENELSMLRQKEKYQSDVQKILIGGILLIFFISMFLIRSIIVKRRKEKTIYDKDKKLYMQEKLLMNTELEKKELKELELNKEVEHKTKQLTTHALNIMQKNKMLMELIKDIDIVSKGSESDLKHGIKNLKQKVKHSLKTDKDWEVFKLYFEQINKDFFAELEKVSPSLNIYDLRHCALIRLNLNLKETASVLNLSPNSIKSARYRLKKKLSLAPEDELYDFIRKI